MKEWLATLLAIMLVDRRRRQISHDTERRRMSAKNAQKMLNESIDRFSTAIDKYENKRTRTGTD